MVESTNSCKLYYCIHERMNVFIHPYKHTCIIVYMNNHILVYNRQKSKKVKSPPNHWTFPLYQTKAPRHVRADGRSSQAYIGAGELEGKLEAASWKGRRELTRAESEAECKM